MPGAVIPLWSHVTSFSCFRSCCRLAWLQLFRRRSPSIGGPVCLLDVLPFDFVLADVAYASRQQLWISVS